MTKLIKVEDIHFASSPSSANECLQRAQTLCEALELSDILFFPSVPFACSKEDGDYLLHLHESISEGISLSFCPKKVKITSRSKLKEEEHDRLRGILQLYSENLSTFLAKLLTPYASKWRLEKVVLGELSNKKKIQEALHLDAFPFRPLHGDRILRFFTNLHPTVDRPCVTSEPFSSVAQKFAGTEKLPFPSIEGKGLYEKMEKKIKRAASFIGLPVSVRSPYDDFMVRLHQFMKKNENFQKGSEKNHWNFPSNSCWAFFTDSLSHAAHSEGLLLEHTFVVPRIALLNPEKAPISILERLTGKIMVEPNFVKTSGKSS